VARARCRAKHSCGERTILLGITKRGDRYLRTLLIHGARAVLRHARHKYDRRSVWIGALSNRRGPNIAAVAVGPSFHPGSCNGGFVPAAMRESRIWYRIKITGYINDLRRSLMDNILIKPALSAGIVKNDPSKYCSNSGRTRPIICLINSYVPIAGAIKRLLNVVVFVVVMVWLLQVFGLVGQISGLRIPPLK
jgi:hypothetical protein